MASIKAAAPTLLALLLIGCTLAQPYAPLAYELSTRVKADALWLIAKAAEPAAVYDANIEALQRDTMRAREYAAGRGPKNQFTTRQWDVMLDPRRDLLGGFIRAWRERKTGLSPAFVESKLVQIGSAFDEIIDLENDKIKGAGGWW